MSAWDIGQNADDLIAVLFVKFGGLPTHGIKMNTAASSACGFFFGFLQKF